MILVYTHKITPRISYIFQTIFEDILQNTVSITDDIDFYLACKTPKIAYSTQKIDEGLFFPSTELLFDKGIKSLETIPVLQQDKTVGIFPVKDSNTGFNFDVFAAAFYLITRYEEYLPHQTDDHQRFLAHQSFAARNNCLHLPMVNYWASRLLDVLQKSFPTTVFNPQKFEFLTTLDIDNAFAYKNKGFLRTTASLIKASVKPKMLKNRIDVLCDKTSDPYNTFDYQEEIHQQYQVKPIYFFLVGDYATYDKNIHYQNEAFRHLIKKIAIANQVGLHPSYLSNKAPQQFSKEKKRLEEIIGQPINKSRQHYLMLKFPITYETLIKNNIKEDFSLGYAETPGFRASIAVTFYFYDLLNEEKTSLKITPFCWMEATAKYYQKLTPDQAIEELNELIKTLQKVKGKMVTVWHNESLSDKEEWKGWRKVYEHLLLEAKKGIN